MRKIITFIIFIASCIAGWQLFKTGYYPMHDDLQVMRLYEMERCLRDGQLPCRLSPDMGYGYGQPMFNYYSVFPYYLGMIPRLFGVQLVDTVKILFFLSLFVSGIFTYLLASSFFTPLAALAAAFAYMFAPYHALDIFVRGAMSESWGLALVPGVLYFIFRLSRKPDYSNLLGFSLVTAAFLTSHHLTTIINLPLFIIFSTLLFITSKNKISFLKYLIISCLLAFGLSAFFTLPVIFERNLIQQQSMTMDYYTYSAHFTTLNQLFINRHWGYGPSKFGGDDDLSFAFGIIQTISLIITPLTLFFYLKRRQINRLIVVGIAFIFCLFSLFMTHNKSTFIWQLIPVLTYIQFPWRFLGMSILTSSILIAGIVDVIKFKKFTLGILLCLGLLFINFNYFSFEKYFYWINDTQKLSGELFQLQIRAAILDYLPNSVKRIPVLPAPSKPEATGLVNINYFDHRSNYFSTEIDIYDNQSTVTFPVVYFPNWTLYQNRQPTPITYRYDNDLGLITVDLPKGHHLIQGWFENTPVRNIGNSITILSTAVLLLWYIKRHSLKS